MKVTRYISLSFDLPLSRLQLLLNFKGTSSRLDGHRLLDYWHIFSNHFQPQVPNVRQSHNRTDKTGSIYFNHCKVFEHTSKKETKCSQMYKQLFRTSDSLECSCFPCSAHSRPIVDGDNYNYDRFGCLTFSSVSRGFTFLRSHHFSKEIF